MIINIPSECLYLVRLAAFVWLVIGLMFGWAIRGFWAKSK